MRYALVDRGRPASWYSTGLARAASALALLAVPVTSYAAEIARVDTNYGRMEFLLDTVRAPEAVRRFRSLATAGRYNGKTIYRVVRGQYVQGGIGHVEAQREPELPGDPLSLSRNVAGAIGFTRPRVGAPHSGTTEFYICVTDRPELDQVGYRTFGGLVAGLPVLERISAARVRPRWRYLVDGVLRDEPAAGARAVAWHEPVEPIVIQSVSILASKAFAK